MDGPLSIGEFKDHHDLVCALNDLEWIWKIHRARHAWHIAFEFGVAIQPIGSVLALPLKRPGLVRNLVAFDNSQSRRYPTHRSKRDHWCCQNRNIRVHSR